MRHVEDILTSAWNAVQTDRVTCRTFDASEIAHSGHSDALFPLPCENHSFNDRLYLRVPALIDSSTYVLYPIDAATGLAVFEHTRQMCQVAYPTWSSVNAHM